MLNTASVMTFLATTDSARARVFYEQVIGLNFVEDDGYALVFDASGTMLRISTVPQLAPAPYTVLGWQVSDIRSEARSLREKGVTFERYPWAGEDKDAICTFPGGAQVAWFKDPDGNLLSLSQLS